MQVEDKNAENHADTLMILCPACQSDYGETLGVVGSGPGSLRATVVMQCNDCETVYLTPPPVVMPGDDGVNAAILGAYDNAVRRLKSEVPSNTRLLYVDNNSSLSTAGNMEGGTFDQILAPLLLESAEDPGALIKGLAVLLTENGRVDVVVGNVSSSSFRFFGGRHWWAYRYPHTRQHCSLKGIGILARNAGLEVADSRSLRVADAWRISIKNWLNDWGASRRATVVLTGGWFVPWLFASCLEAFAGLRGKASLIVVRLVKP